MNNQAPIKIAVLDDYGDIARKVADWGTISNHPDVAVFHDHLSDQEALVERLKPFDVICIMRERTPITRALIERLPNLKLIASTGPRNAAIDLEAARERSIDVVHTGYDSAPTTELTWALILALARNIWLESASVRAGGWQTNVGIDLKGKTLGLLGLGNIGSRVAEIAKAFGMNVVAWSQNLTADQAAEHGATLVSKEALFEQSDLISIHVILSDRTKGLVGAQELELMKPTALLVNTSRGPIIDESALIRVLQEKKIGGAALDVFEQEPLPVEHIFRKLDNVLATPHIGYCSESLYKTFYRDSVSNIDNWIKCKSSHSVN